MNSTRSPVLTRSKPTPSPTPRKSLVQEYLEYISSVEKGSRSSSRAQSRDKQKSHRSIVESPVMMDQNFTIGISKNQFIFHYVIGTGGFGRVITSKNSIIHFSQ